MRSRLCAFVFMCGCILCECLFFMWVGECVYLECKGSVYVCAGVCVCLYMTFENTAVHWALAHWGFVYVCSCFFFFFSFCVFCCGPCARWLCFRVCGGGRGYGFLQPLISCELHILRHACTRMHRGATSIISPPPCFHYPPPL